MSASAERAILAWLARAIADDGASPWDGSTHAVSQAKRRGLVAPYSAGSATRYRLTDAGRAALSAGKVAP